MVPDLMRAAGFYPSNAAIADIMHHISFLAHTRDVDSMHHIDFDTFLSLYSNHRPLFDVTTEDIVDAFGALGAPPPAGRLTRDALVAVLKQLGEPMSAEELQEALQALTGEAELESAMPPTLDAAVFANDILGFEEQESAEAVAVA